MKARHLNHNEESEINITPMLDVVFIMLIFFIVTTSFTKETGLNLFKSSQTVTEKNKVKLATKNWIPMPSQSMALPQN